MQLEFALSRSHFTVGSFNGAMSTKYNFVQFEGPVANLLSATPAPKEVF